MPPDAVATINAAVDGATRSDEIRPAAEKLEQAGSNRDRRPISGTSLPPETTERTEIIRAAGGRSIELAPRSARQSPQRSGAG